MTFSEWNGKWTYCRLNMASSAQTIRSNKSDESWGSSSYLFVTFILEVCRKVKVKPLILRHPEQGLARPVGLMRQFQSEQFWALLRVEENPKGKATRHWLWRVKDIPHVAPSQTQSHAAVRTWTQTIAVRGERVTTAPPSPCLTFDNL